MISTKGKETPQTRKGKAMTIHEKKSGTEYFERARKIAAAVIREIADRTHADGNATEAENNATMSTLTAWLDGTQPQ